MSDDAGTLAGKAVLVMGGSAGIGLAVAEQLLQQGAQVMINGRSAERGEQALSRLRERFANVGFVAGDGGDPSAAVHCVAATVQRFGRLDVLVSAGAQGSTTPTPFADMTPEQLRSGFESRFLPRVFAVHAAIPALGAAGGGAIVLVTTDAARHPTPGESMIGAAGASLILLTKALARELARSAIRVNAVALTLTSDTPSWERIFSQPSFENRLFSKALERFPSGRAPTAEEAARAVVFLAGAHASQITGQTLSVNGGLSFGGW